MGIPSWITRFFRRPAKSTLEQLETIENEILDLESIRTSSIDSEKRFVFRLLLYSFILFGMAFLFVYYYYWPSTQTGKALLWTSLLIYPSIVSGLKWGFHAFFLRNILRADERLKSLREEKQRLLEEVMETETFNKAQQILKRFDPLMFARLTVMDGDPTQTPRTSSSKTRSSSSRKNVRNVPDGDNCPATPVPSSVMKSKAPCPNGFDSITPITRFQNPAQPHARLPRPILPRERSILDKLLDALVGDGPDKRCALICQECAGHNGMALREEFEFLAFRCCYCSHFNPPRRTRLKTPIPPNVTPKLSLDHHHHQQSNHHPRDLSCAASMPDLRDRSQSPSPVPLDTSPPTLVDEGTSEQTVVTEADGS